MGLPRGSVVKNLPANAKEAGSIPGLGTSLGKGNGNPIQSSCLGNSMDKGAWQRLQSTGSQRAEHDWATRQQQAPDMQFNSVQFRRSGMSDSLWPHESQHTRPPSPSPTPGVDSNPCPSSQWCHPTISSSVIPFSSCLQSLPASGSFPMSQLCMRWQSTGVSASASVLPVNTQDWSPSGWTGWLSLQSKGFSRVFSNTTVQKLQVFGTQLSSQSNSHIHTS